MVRPELYSVARWLGLIQLRQLAELRALHEAKLSDGDRWRVHSYNKGVRLIRPFCRYCMRSHRRHSHWCTAHIPETYPVPEGSSSHR